MRLIDADAAKSFAKECWPSDVIRLPIDGFLDNCPSVDAVPVVRCKDCEHYRNGICEKIEYIMDGYYNGTFDVKRPDDFCSYGAKKSGGGENAAD